METGVTGDAMAAQPQVSDACGDRPVDLLASQFESFYRLVYRYLLHRVFDRELAEELTAETFYKAAQFHRPVQGGTQGLRVWLLRVATNLANTHHRKRRLRQFLFERFSRTKTVMTEPDAAANSADQQRQKHVRHVIGSLRSKDQTVVVLRYYMGMSFADIAGVVSCREDAVRVRLSRAVQELRRRLGVQND